MQVARLLEPREERSLAAKLRQAVRAVAARTPPRQDGDPRPLSALAPFGGNLEGVRAASFAYFGKEPKRLSTAEAALLVALPQAPETRRPDRFPEAARKARDRVLARVAAAGLATAAEVAAAREEPIPTARKPFPHLAPHVAEQVVAEAPADAQPQARPRCPAAGQSREPRPRAQRRAAPAGLDRHPRRRQRDRRDPRLGRRRRLFRDRAGRRARPDARAALARLGAETVHLRARLRQRHRPSRDHAGGPARRATASMCPRIST